MDEIRYKPIGIIHSPFKQPSGTPIQPAGARDVEGTVEVVPEYVEGLKDIEGFSHIFLIYHFHLSKGYFWRLLRYLRLAMTQGTTKACSQVKVKDSLIL